MDGACNDITGRCSARGWTAVMKRLPAASAAGALAAYRFRDEKVRPHPGAPAPPGEIERTPYRRRPPRPATRMARPSAVAPSGSRSLPRDGRRRQRRAPLPEPRQRERPAGSSSRPALRDSGLPRRPDRQGPGVEIDVAILPHPRHQRPSISAPVASPPACNTRRRGRCRLTAEKHLAVRSRVEPRTEADQPAHCLRALSTNRATASVSPFAPLPLPRVRGMQGRRVVRPDGRGEAALRARCSRPGRLWSARQYAARAAGRA